jgi:hypothetical protein
MSKRILGVISVVFGIGLVGCASDEQKLKETGSHQLSGDEITALFSDAHESYESRDRETTVTAIGEWAADGTMRAEWHQGANSGEVAGSWYVENDLRCVRFDQDMTPNPECTKIFETGDGTYTSIWPDGKIHGIHTMTR